MAFGLTPSRLFLLQQHILMTFLSYVFCENIAYRHFGRMHLEVDKTRVKQVSCYLVLKQHWFQISPSFVEKFSFSKFERDCLNRIGSLEVPPRITPISWLSDAWF